MFKWQEFRRQRQEVMIAYIDARHKVFYASQILKYVTLYTYFKKTMKTIDVLKATAILKVFIKCHLRRKVAKMRKIPFISVYARKTRHVLCGIIMIHNPLYERRAFLILYPFLTVTIDRVKMKHDFLHFRKLFSSI